MNNLYQWIPDWRIAENYPQTDKNKLNQLTANEVENFAWQFLRRNPIYQQDYEYYKQTKSYEYCLFHREVEGLDAGISSEYLKEFFLFKERYHLAKWTIKAGEPIVDIFNPANSNSFVAFRSMELTSSIGPTMKNSQEIAFILNKPSEALFKIDISLPINPQIEKIKEFALMLQKGGSQAVVNKKFNVQILIRFLRILDAMAFNETLNNMAEVLAEGVDNCQPDYLGRKRIEASMKSAIHIRDGGYRFFYT